MGNIIEIRDFAAGELDVYARLTEAQLLNRDRPEEGLFIAESPKVVMRALDAGYEPVSILAEDRHINGEAREVLARCPDIPVYTASFEVLMQLTGYKLTRGLLCAMRRRPLPRVEELCRRARRIAVLENVMNPTNVGAIIRSAAALNMDAVLLTPGCSNPLYRRAARVSMGTVFQIPWTFLEEEEAGAWPREGMDYLKSLGFSTAAMALHDESVDIDDPVLRQEEKLALILGTEGEGLQEETIAASDYTIKIPMSHGVDSLNVAVASAVAFWELGK
ncbi:MULTISPECIES: TrmH family RNA methyltransferase [Clostridia]|uniref:RNA methyltransferase n=1 Tax=Faecalicatena fissicatena TaxID=290055 RepID=A0ABS2EBD6_9FIRM|nr:MULTISPECIES: RNA methyltransferase [Clostridia]MBM6738941.1 RNA methyltransferase [Faecalicatena fissicatena]HIX98148.1 RNA methyltransferase [Candidatus Dorea intestinigallinarum]